MKTAKQTLEILVLLVPIDVGNRVNDCQEH